MKRGLRIAALAIGLVTVAVWFFSGPNLGQTITSVSRVVVDPATGVEQRITEDRFLAGIDFLAAGLVLAFILFVASNLLQRPREAS